MLKKGEQVVRILNGAGLKTASLTTIQSIKNGKVKLSDSELLFDQTTLQEIEPPIPGYWMELVPIEK